mgnify:CR=1 FL=1
MSMPLRGEESFRLPHFFSQGDALGFHVAAVSGPGKKRPFDAGNVPSKLLRARQFHIPRPLYTSLLAA